MHKDRQWGIRLDRGIFEAQGARFPVDQHLDFTGEEEGAVLAVQQRDHEDRRTTRRAVRFHLTGDLIVFVFLLGSRARLGRGLGSNLLVGRGRLPLLRFLGSGSGLGFGDPPLPERPRGLLRPVPASSFVRRLKPR